MLAAISPHLVHDLTAALSTIRFARHYMPHWMLYPAYALAAFIVACSVGGVILKWKQSRENARVWKEQLAKLSAPSLQRAA